MSSPVARVPVTVIPTKCEVDGSQQSKLYALRYHYGDGSVGSPASVVVCLECLLTRVTNRHIGDGMTITRIR